MNFGDGAPYELKGSRTVWVGGKGGDNIKVLPIDIGWDAVYESDGFGPGARESLAGLSYFASETEVK